MNAVAQTVPNAAEADRIMPRKNDDTFRYKKPVTVLPKKNFSHVQSPAAAKNVHITFKGVHVFGAQAFSEGEFRPLYKEFINKQTTLEVAWIIADRITNQYNARGYFLSRAYVPEQEVKGGFITIKVVEGYIGDVRLENPELSNGIIDELIADLLTKRPLKTEQLDKFLLTLNDLPGKKFKGVLSSIQSQDEAATRMTLIVTDASGDSGNIGINNYGSRYIGPHEMLASYKTSLFDLQETSVGFSTSLPTSELQLVSFQHSVIATPDIKIGFSFDKTRAAPGYTLRQYDVKSRAQLYTIDMNYKLIRQKQENLWFDFTFNSNNTNTILQGNRISHDQIRAIRASAAYDAFDDWDGHTIANIKLSQGIDGFGASNTGDLNLTREDARPDFTKAELFIQRQQALDDDLSLVTSAAMQRASGTLYASEQFGYGGQIFGRAYDSSDIIGDHGIAGSLELRYAAPSLFDALSLTPYAFYDIGKTWSERPTEGDSKAASGSSAGIGARFETSVGVSGNLGIAYPLTRNVAAPIYGADGNAPRVLFQVSKDF